MFNWGMFNDMKGNYVEKININSCTEVCLISRTHQTSLWHKVILRVSGNSEAFNYIMCCGVLSVHLKTQPCFVLVWHKISSEGEAQALEIWRVYSTLLLPLLPFPLWLGVVVPVRASSMGQINPFKHLSFSIEYLISVAVNEKKILEVIILC